MVDTSMSGLKVFLRKTSGFSLVFLMQKLSMSSASSHHLSQAFVQLSGIARTSRAEYADKTLKQLSVELTRDYGKGFSHRNLEYFRKFYLNYSNRISQTPSAKYTASRRTKTTKGKDHISQTLSAFSQSFPLSWSHYILLMKIDNLDETTIL